MPLIPGDYVTGHWVGLMPTDLLWEKPYDKPFHPRLPGYIAPTFSWASINSPIKWTLYADSKGTKPLASVVNAECKSLHGDPCLQVSSGYLTIDGPMIVALYSFLPDELRWSSYRLTVGGWMEDGVNGRDPLRFEADYALQTLDKYHVKDGEQLTLVAIAEITFGSSSGLTYFLVLKQIATSPDEYWRIGLLKMHYSSKELLKDAEREILKIV
jgi:hypothetical protein